MSVSSTEFNEIDFMCDKVKLWLSDIPRYKDANNASIIERFNRDVRLFTEDCRQTKGHTSSDMVDLSDRFYVLEAMYKKIVNDRF